VNALLAVLRDLVLATGAAVLAVIVVGATAAGIGVARRRGPARPPLRDDGEDTAWFAQLHTDQPDSAAPVDRAAVFSRAPHEHDDEAAAPQPPPDPAPPQPTAPDLAPKEPQHP
jgi:hypothetical protein